MVGREKYVAAIGEKLQLHSTFKYLRRKIPNRHITNHGIVDHTTLSGFVSVCACVCYLIIYDHLLLTVKVVLITSLMSMLLS